MKAATLFSGIGAPECACPDWDWKFAAEIEDYPAAVLAHHFPGVTNLGDVSAPDFIERAKQHGSIGVLIFGTPCQSFSVAGKRLGMGDPRGNLALYALKVASELGVRWVVFENVPGLFSSFSGGEHAARDVQKFHGPGGGEISANESRDFAAFLTAARECGYLGAWRVLNAQHFGVPQRRRRVFFVGYLGDWRGPAAVLFERGCMSGDFAPSGTAGAHASAFTSNSFGRAGADVKTGQAGHIVPVVPDIVGQAMSAKWAKGSSGPAGDEHFNLVPMALNLRGRREGARPELSDKASLRAASGGSSRSYIAFHGSQDPDVSGDVTHPLGQNSGREACIAFNAAQITSPHNRSKAAPGAPAPTLDRDADRMTIAVEGVRRMTPLECERLQGFPDHWTAIEWGRSRAGEGPDLPRYKALGNSMAVPVMRWILNRLELVDGIIGAAD